MKFIVACFTLMFLLLVSIQAFTQKDALKNPTIISVVLTTPKNVLIGFSNGQKMYIDFYGETIFRVFMDPGGAKPHNPIANPPAQILVDNPSKQLSALSKLEVGNQLTVANKSLSILFDKTTSVIKVLNKRTNKIAVEFLSPIQIETGKTSLLLKENPNEYFYGGGVQNGRFSHKGKIIAIENQNSWTDGGVASPNPFFWSTNGYGILWHTFKPGRYDFGATENGKVKLFHNEGYADVFFMIDEKAETILQDFYQLTGNPVLLPTFGFYEGHLNAYNRDYWKPDTTGTRGVLFEDGKRYIESQKNNGGIKESLNGELNNYQFSARGVIDRYAKHDMPLGWILPNDGYGAGYGQTSTLDSNILNLKNLGDYARRNGVQIGLWTQSDLHPKPGISALLQRDLENEVGVAGVRVLKTDVAWVGAGYSFGLHGVADAASIMTKQGNNARPFIISLDGWAGTQRYATIWSGDQTGGNWEYIRFHIPTYIGSGLSGQPNITSDMDGIFGGKNAIVNIRDFQWKTFTPMQLNMDGWGANEKYPHALGEPATSINRMYLKWKSELLPYAYSIAHQSVNGLPIMRAMFLEEANAYTKSTATQYQYMFGPNFLIAPIYQSTHSNILGDDIRNNIYLPNGKWIDYFSGDIYEGGKVFNNFETPIWKLPVFVKNGAIIPLTNPNNHPTGIDKKWRIFECYPSGKTTFTLYNDDGITEAYKQEKNTTTIIESEAINNKATVTIKKTKGDFDGFQKQQATELRMNVTASPKKITALVGNKNVLLTPVQSPGEFERKTNVYYYGRPNLNQFATPDSPFARLSILKNPQIRIKLAATDITANEIKITVDGFIFSPANHTKSHTGKLTPPVASVRDADRQAFSLTPRWLPVPNADFYEVICNGMTYTTIKDTSFVLEGLAPETSYPFSIRAVNKTSVSQWKDFNATTQANPLRFAIRGISGTCNKRSQPGNGLAKLFDFDETDMWHTSWDSTAVPFTLVMNLNSINQIEKLQYLPRNSGSNGIITTGKIFYSTNKTDWTEAGTINWKRNQEKKEFIFNNKPTARYIKIDVSEAVGNFGSGAEMYVFRVPGTTSIIPGDINNDLIIDHNDLTSYMNYTGLRKGDADFEGYISKGDLNDNNLIDAYDISTVATKLDGDVWEESKDPIAGKLEISTDKKNYKAGEIINVKVKGIGLRVVNALSFALPYDPANYEYIGIEPRNMEHMDNFTFDRLHTNGIKSLYPTFVNVGNKETLNGSKDLFIIQFKVKRDLEFNLKPIDGILVDKRMEMAKW